jgi:hypothetical protein
MQVQIVNVDVEVGKPGPKGWSKAVVDYMVNGQNRKQNIMSFTNPQVYKDVTSGKFTGETVEVSITKNAKGYDEWAAIQSTNSTSAAPAAPQSGQATVSPASASLTAALKFLEMQERPVPDTSEVLKIAQEFTDWVFDEGEAVDGPTD